MAERPKTKYFPYPIAFVTAADRETFQNKAHSISISTGMHMGKLCIYALEVLGEKIAQERQLKAEARKTQSAQARREVFRGDDSDASH